MIAIGYVFAVIKIEIEGFKMELKNKKIVFLGDSITQGVGVSDISKTYWKKFEENDGAFVKGFGISGTRIAKQQKEYNKEYDENSFITRVGIMDEDADIVVVFGGTNDYGHGDAAMGNMEDRTDDTFYGALHNLYTELINKYPYSDIVVMTPCHRLEENRKYNKEGIRNIATLKDYVDAIKEVTRSLTTE